MTTLADPNLGWSALAVSILAECDIEESFDRLFNPPKCNKKYRRATRVKGRNVLEDDLTKIMLEMRRKGMGYEAIAQELGVTKWCVFKRLKRLKARETA